MPEPSQEESKPNDQPKIEEPVWTYRGYSLSASEFVTAMVHFFRAEISRANIWRTRLDATTNWAVVATGATLSIAFSQSSSYHAVIIMNTLLVTLFLFIEARRYRYYELWSYRVRLMETDFYAAMLVPPFQPASDWAETLAENLLHPRYPISLREAFGRRLRRNYFWLFVILGMAWIAKLWLYPIPAVGIDDFIRRASLGPVQGWVVLAVGIFYYVFLFSMGLFTLGMHQATGEVLPHFVTDGVAESRLDSATDAKAQPWYRPHRKRQQILALIVTDEACAQNIADGVMQNMRRGVTALEGTGMFSGEKRRVLMVALTITEINNLKTTVNAADPEAFVITTTAKEILGRGFVPLRKEKER